MTNLLQRSEIFILLALPRKTSGLLLKIILSPQHKECQGQLTTGNSWQTWSCIQAQMLPKRVFKLWLL